MSNGSNRSHRPIDTARSAFNPTLPRVGRVQRQCKRCLTIHNPASMAQLKQWCYAGREHRHWHYEVIREALVRIGAKPIGRAHATGRPGIWAISRDNETRGKNSQTTD
jgi:hypothetical protein